MDLINEFKKRRYVIWNVNENKLPIVGTGDAGWSKISFDNVKQYWRNNTHNWGFRTGLQTNGDYIIGLDFDMWYKKILLM